MTEKPSSLTRDQDLLELSQFCCAEIKIALASKEGESATAWEEVTLEIL